MKINTVPELLNAVYTHDYFFFLISLHSVPENESEF